MPADYKTKQFEAVGSSWKKSLRCGCTFAGLASFHYNHSRVKVKQKKKSAHQHEEVLITGHNVEKKRGRTTHSHNAMNFSLFLNYQRLHWIECV